MAELTKDLNTDAPQPKRGLSGMYFFSTEKDGRRGEPTVFEDLSEADQHKVLDRESIEFVRGVALALAKTLREIADKFDIVNSYENE